MALDCTLTVSQLLSSSSAAAVQNLAQKTICGWVNIDSENISEILLLAQAGATDEHFSVFFRSDSGIKLAFLVDWSTTDGLWQSAAAWGTGLHHFAITYDRGLTTNDPVFYKDGASISITEVTGPAGTVRNGTSNTLKLGSNGTVPSIDGKKQDIRIYNRILTASEILALASADRTIHMNDSGLVFHAPLMYYQSLYPTVPAAGTLGGTQYTYDRINGYILTPAGSPVAAADMVYGTAF